MIISEIKLVILGSGTCVPSLKRSSCSFFIKTDTAGLLFDVGAGTIRRLMEAGFSINDVTHIFISHLHPDHTGELVSFLFSKKNPALLIKKPLIIIAGKGFQHFYSSLKNIYGGWIDPGPDMLSVFEADIAGEDIFHLNGIIVKTLPVEHSNESIAFRVEHNSKTISYSGDSSYCRNLVLIANDADLFICESATPDEFKMDNHLTPSLAGRIARDANVKKLVLTHFYPECEKTNIAKECRRTYDGELVLAEDLMEFIL